MRSPGSKRDLVVAVIVRHTTADPVLTVREIVGVVDVMVFARIDIFAGGDGPDGDAAVAGHFVASILAEHDYGVGWFGFGWRRGRDGGEKSWFAAGAAGLE